MKPFGVDYRGSNFFVQFYYQFISTYAWDSTVQFNIESLFLPLTCSLVIERIENLKKGEKRAGNCCMMPWSSNIPPQTYLEFKLSIIPEVWQP